MEEAKAAISLFIQNNGSDIAFAFLGAVFGVALPFVATTTRSVISFFQNRNELSILSGEHFFYRVDGENRATVRAVLNIRRGLYSPLKFSFKLPRTSATTVHGRGYVRAGFVILEGSGGNGQATILFHLHTSNLEQKFRISVYSGLRSVQTAPHCGLAIISRNKIDSQDVRRILGSSSTSILLGAEYNRKVREISKLMLEEEQGIKLGPVQI